MYSFHFTKIRIEMIPEYFVYTDTTLNCDLIISEES